MLGPVNPRDAFTRRSVSGRPQKISPREDRHIRPGEELLSSEFALQRHTASRAGVMEWGVIAYNTRSPISLISGIMKFKRYVLDIVQQHALPLIQRLTRAIFLQDIAWPRTTRVSQNCLHTVITFFGLYNPQICLQ
ncbi:transposable element Tcb2 transposase [Trichonephila clavipes]|nr:transposable element Tcb2 transposase [Trichonephila clavipes]